VLRITEILTNDNKPTIGPRVKPEKKVVAKTEDDADEAPKVAKKAAAKKPAAKKAAPKPAAKKAPAKKGKSDKK
jgi:large subunit ribosomal protein L21